MPRSTMDAVGSKARCGSAVLISNERSTTSVPVGADGPLVAPVAIATVARAPKAATAAVPAARARKRFMCFLPGEDEELPSLALGACERKPPRLGRGRSGRLRAGLEPAGGAAAGGDLQQHRIVARATVECVRAA